MPTIFGSHISEIHVGMGVCVFDIVLAEHKRAVMKQDPVSTMQKTGWTNDTAFQSEHLSSLV